MTKSRYSKLSQVKLHYLEEGDGDVVVPAPRIATYLAQLAPRNSEALIEISSDRARHAGAWGQFAPGRWI
jgi:hypothetical protein